MSRTTAGAGPELLLLSTPLAGDTLPGGVSPSLSNITLGSALRAAGADVAVLDPSVDLGPLGDGAVAGLLARIADAVLAERPRIVGVSCLSPVEGRFGVAVARALAARDPRVPVVLGGIWATACAEEIVRRFPEVRAVVAGPGEPAALGLARGGLDDPESLPGLVWRAGDEVRRNPAAPTPERAPPVDLSLLRNPARYDIFCWLTSRGCPFHCAFCTERITSPGYRHAPLERVAADIDALAAHRRAGADEPWFLWICDPLFGAHRQRLAAICDHLAATPLEFLAESRVDVLHPDDVPRLRAAGCTLLYFGLEAVSRRSLVELDKIDDRPSRYRAYLDGARALVEACVRHDVLPVLGVLQPVPGDRPEDLAEALAFLRELADTPRRLGPAARGPGPCFHAFPLRFDRGAPYEGRDDHLAAQGVTRTPVADTLFEDRYLVRASPAIDEETAEAFRAEVRALNPPDPAVRRRLFRSFPRPYVRFD